MLVRGLDGAQRKLANRSPRCLQAVNCEDQEVVPLELPAAIVQREVALDGNADPRWKTFPVPLLTITP